ncbi:Clp protease N-terminal domain-containing protein [Stackebrandtia soli]|uniref:Clp protease N-terminal domain-containing protein n=1 Tax=Stackebrandtia soli TaxID=1892856 RepID=UPI0039E9DE2A
MNEKIPVRLDELIDYVKTQHPSGSDLERLSEAVLVAERLTDHADTLVGHFVDQARRAGASWTDIGQYMGVTKQAAQKRFVSKKGTEENPLEATGRFTGRAKIVMEKAAIAARNRGNTETTDVHILVGLLQERESLAIVAMESLNADVDAIAAAATEALPPGGEPRSTPIPTMDARATRVFERTIEEAVNMGHNYVGTEHILLALLEDKGEPATILSRHGVTKPAIRKPIQSMLAQLAAANDPK